MLRWQSPNSALKFLLIWMVSESPYFIYRYFKTWFIRSYDELWSPNHGPLPSPRADILSRFAHHNWGSIHALLPRYDYVQKYHDVGFINAYIYRRSSGVTSRTQRPLLWEAASDESLLHRQWLRASAGLGAQLQFSEGLFPSLLGFDAFIVV